MADNDQESREERINQLLKPEKKKVDEAILLATGSKFKTSLLKEIISEIKKKYKDKSVYHVKDPKEFAKFLGYSIQSLIIEDSFGGLSVNLSLVNALKKKGPLPVLFLTSDEEILIQKYSKIFEKVELKDNYLELETLRVAQVVDYLLSVIPMSFTSKERRRSKRFFVDIPIFYQDFSQESLIKANLVEMSLHGGVLKSESRLVLKRQVQIVITIPTSFYNLDEAEDFFRVSSKVKRVMLSGKEAAFEWEHLNSEQTAKLTKLIASIDKERMIHQNE